MDLSIITEAFNGLNLGNSTLLRIMPIALISICCIAVTRNLQRLKAIHLPMALAWQAVGFGPGPLAYPIYTIFFVNSMLSFSQLGDVITGTWERTKQIATGTRDAVRGRAATEAAHLADEIVSEKKKLTNDLTKLQKTKQHRESLGVERAVQRFDQSKALYERTLPQRIALSQQWARLNELQKPGAKIFNRPRRPIDTIQKIIDQQARVIATESRMQARKRARQARQ